MATPPMQDLPVWPVTTFESLSDDCLLLIINELRGVKVKWDWQTLEPPLQMLSGVNKRLRSLCLPHVFNLRHLTIKLWEQEDPMLKALMAVRESNFAAPITKAISVTFRATEYDSVADKIIIVPSTNKLGEEVVHRLEMLSSIRELRISTVKAFDRSSKATLRKTTFSSIKVLDMTSMPEAALFIRACPNLTTLRSDFPCAKFKTTFQAIQESAIDNLELNNHKGWRIKQMTDIQEYIGSISHLSLKGEIKVKATELLPPLQDFQNIKSFAITTDPWVNYSYYRRHYVDDRFMDAVDDAKDESPLNEDPTAVLSAIFNAFRSASTAWLLPRFNAEQFRVARNEDGTVATLMPEALRPSISSHDFDYSPFPGFFPKGEPFA